MPNSLNPRTFLSTTIADALDLFRGRVDLGDWATLSVPGLDKDEDELNKAHLKSKMRWNG